jgi:chromate transporter
MAHSRPRLTPPAPNRHTSPAQHPAGEAPPQRSLLSLFLMSLKLGCIAFGGPVAHISMLYRELVEQEKWTSRQRFVELLAVTFLVPGPNSTLMAMNLGYVQRGVLGVWLVGTAFILPGAGVVLLLTWGYSTYGVIPEVEAVFWGIRPVVMAIIVDAVVRLTPMTVPDRFSVTFVVLAIVASLTGVTPAFVIIGAGVLAWAFTSLKSSLWSGTMAIAPPLAVGTGSHDAGNQFSLLVQLALFFGKVAILLFGGGYVLIGFLKSEAVDERGWLTDTQVVDLVAIAQLAPGPILTSVTGAGFLIAGFWGAVVATVFLFLPSFFFAMILGRMMPHLLKSHAVNVVLRGIMPAVLGIIAVAVAQIAADFVISVPALVLASLSLIALRRTSIQSTWLILGGALIGVASGQLVGF